MTMRYFFKPYAAADAPAASTTNSSLSYVTDGIGNLVEAYVKVFKNTDAAILRNTTISIPLLPANSLQIYGLIVSVVSGDSGQEINNVIISSQQLNPATNILTLKVSTETNLPQNSTITVWFTAS